MRGLASSLHNMNFNVIVPRLSGHGETVQSLRRIHAEVWLREAAEAVDSAAKLKVPLSIVGLSFGGLLALNAAVQRPEVRGVVAMSVPLTLEPKSRELLLTLFSYLPNSLLDHLWINSKKQRREGYLALMHHAYRQHSVGAAARLIQIRRKVLSRLNSVRCPVLVFQDPLDHHLPAASSLVLQDYLTNCDSKVEYIPDGQHELLLGHRHQKVIDDTCKFLESLSVS